jgi:phosphoglycerate dehydrogenase-like enzyme
MSPQVPLRIIVHADNPDPLANQLATTHPDVVVETCSTYEGLPRQLDEFRPDVVYSIRFAGSRNFPADALLGKGGPKWISIGGSGVDHLGQWDPKKIQVTNSAGVAASMMAEYAFGSMLHFSLDVPGLERDKKSRNWRARSMSSLNGKTLLIVGLGQTGQAVARLAKGFGMSVIGTRARPRPMDCVDEVHSGRELPELWGRADFIVICAPLLATTRGLVGAAAFSAMKQGAVLVDVSRGGIVDQSALVAALVSGRLAGAALDVFESEPLPLDSPLWEIENLIVSPHCSSVFDGWEASSMQMFCDNVERWKTGAPLANLVDPFRGY